MLLCKFTIITLFPEALQPYLDSSMLFKAQERGIISVEYVNLRDFGLGPHRSVDDTPYGGGDGMLLRCEPVFAAIESIKSQDPTAKVILPTPVGEVWNQSLARRFAGVEDGVATSASAAFSETSKNSRVNPAIGFGQPTFSAASREEQAATTERDTRKDGLSRGLQESMAGRTMNERLHYIILCPHYEGYDERIMTLVDFPVSLGNYVLTGGELPALILIDSITRLLPGVLGGETSAAIESFSDAASSSLEFPQYTKPADFRGMKVPEILLSGHHGKIAEWRAAESARRTAAREKTPNP